MQQYDFSQYFDHTNLKNDFDYIQLNNLIDEAKEYGFNTICIPPLYVSKAKEIYKDIKITTVIDFPFGYSNFNSKISKLEAAYHDGADEFDLVMAPMIIKNKEYLFYENVIASAKQSIGSKVLKIIIETSQLDNSEIIDVSKICESANADFIKTSSGYGSRGADLRDIELIKLGAPNTKIKASGGIKTLADALSFIDMGVSRIGSSNSVEILKSFVVANRI